MRPLAVFLCCLPVVLGISSGNVSLCDAQSPALGCTSWGYKIDPVTNKPVINRLNCTMTGTRLMAWTAAPVRSASFTVRSGNGPDPASDVAFYHPGEYVTIYVRATTYKLRYRGLMLYAVNAGGNAVGSWKFAPESEAVPFWTPSYWAGACWGGQSNAVFHHNADEKPYTVAFRWLAPPAGTGLVTFKALFKGGPANNGYFYWPNGNAGDLALSERNTAVDGAVPPLVWFKADTNARTCTYVCQTMNGRAAVDTALMQQTVDGGEGISTYQPSATQAFARTQLCRNPPISSCATDAPAVDGEGFCLFSAPTCPGWRNTSTDPGRLRWCACTTSGTPPANCPIDAGWPSTGPGLTQTMSCAAGQTGNKTRTCSTSGVWGVVVDTCVTPATCTDGIQNQGEFAIDCGGTSPCPACLNCPAINCGAHGRCIEGTPAVCSCNMSYTGDRCQYPPADPCGNWSCTPSNETANPRGTCTVLQPQNQPFCACNQPYQGVHCEIAPTATCTDGVLNQDEAGIDCGGTKCPACDTFFWEVGAWGACDKNCGGGTQTRGQACKNSTGQVRPNSDCAGIHLPITQQPCNPDPCPAYSWVAGPWQNCTTTCGGGTQIRAVDCWSTIGPSIVTQPGLCPSASKPATQQGCNLQGCTGPRWVSDPWAVCDRSCGGGLQTRASRCKDVNTEVDPSLCTATIPPGTQACNIFPCVTYSWYLCPGWGPCTATCNGGDGMLGQEFRDLYCTTNTGGVADFTLCDPLLRPINTLTVCNTQKCNDFNWMANGDWSACNGTHRSRTFHCHAADGTLATLAQCSKIALPTASIPCTPGAVVCPPLITNAPTPVLSGASTLRHGLPVLMALVTSMLFSSRSTSFTMGILIMLSLVGPTEAHNWLYTPSRASSQASTVAPCQGRKDSDLHQQVGRDQPFTIKFATGHDRDSYFVTVKGEDADWLGHDNFENMVDAYLAAAGSNEDHTGLYTRRYHGYSTPRGNQAAYDDGSNSIGAQFTGAVPTTALYYPKHNRSVSVGMYNYKDTVLSNDRRASYYSATYPWLISAARLPHLMHLPDDFDAFHWTIPGRMTLNGHYIVHWRWSGYYDCTDVDLQPGGYTQYPDGLLNASQHIWSQVDHCQYEQPIGIVTQCMEVFTDVAPCIASVSQGSWNVNNRYGLNVVPFRNPATVGLGFQNQVDIPWRDGACSSSWNLLTGPVSDVANLNWGTWDAKTNVATGVKCTGQFDSESNWDLKRAVGYCVGLGSRCAAISWQKGTTGVDVHVGKWTFTFCSSTGTSTDTNFNTYTPKALSGANYNTGAQLNVINYSPSKRISPTPVPNQLNDGGGIYGSRNGATYGWLCNSSTDCVYCCDTYGCPPYSGASPGCCAMDPLYTYAYGVNEECPQQPGVRKVWELAVSNGVYDVTTRHYSDDGSATDLSGCNVEGTRMIPDEMGCLPAGTELTQRVEVTDGQLTLNGDGGLEQGCWYLNLMRYKMVAGPGVWPQTWMPDAINNPTWEQDVGAPMPIGLVTLENYNYYENGDPMCASWWLFKGSACLPSRPMNYFKNSASEGAVIGVSNSSCAGGSCPGGFATCGWVTLPNGYERRHYIDCKGAVGRYVFVRLPGQRHLTVSITAYRFVPDVPANENPLVCYGVEARPTTTTDPEFIISLDPEDPIFYSTCYVRNPNVIWINVAPAAVPDRWRFAGRCISCDTFEANKAIVKATQTSLPRPWVVNDGQCTNCFLEHATIPPRTPQWMHVAQTQCEDMAGNRDAQLTSRNVPVCTGVPWTSCLKRLYARGRTENEPTYGSATLTAEECQIIAARDPECGLSVQYRVYGTTYSVCECYRSHACCGRCSSAYYASPYPSPFLSTQVYEYGSIVDLTPDPFCARGLKSTDNSTCCPTTCKNSAGVNVCASGANCRTAVGGAQCCKGNVAANSTIFNMCTQTGAPCKLR